MEAAGGEEGGTNFSQISGVFVLAMDFSAEFLQKSKDLPIAVRVFE